MTKNSPFTHLLFTNDSPTASEAAQIRAWYVEPALEVAQLNAEISQLGEALAALTRRRDELSSVVDAHRAVLSRVRDIPTEILQQIFLLLTECYEMPRMYRARAPLLLGRVCSRWRRISLGTPELWASLAVAAPRRVKKSAEVTLTLPAEPDVEYHNAMREWVGRSGNLPITFSLSYSLPSSSPRPSLAPYLAIVRPLSRRWKNILLERVAISDLEVLRDVESIDVPLLERFVFRNSLIAAVSDDSVISSLAFLNTAARLHSVHLRLNWLPSGIRQLPLPWNQLTDLRLLSAPTDSNDVLSVLAQCSRLRRCTFHYTEHAFPSLPVQTIYLAELRSLSLFVRPSNGNDDDATPIIDSLNLPQLQDLELESRLRNRSLARPILNLILRSSCAIQKLVLRQVNFNLPEDLIHCLRHTQHLRNLSLRKFDDMDDAGAAFMHILRALTIAPDPGSVVGQPGQVAVAHLCPKLTTVALCDLEISMIEDAIAFLRSRLQAPPGDTSRLGSAHFAFRGFFGLAERERVRRKLSGDIETCHITIGIPGSELEFTE